MNSPSKSRALAALFAIALLVPTGLSALGVADVPPPPDSDQKLPEAGSASGKSASSEAGSDLGSIVEEEVELAPEPKEPSVPEAAASLRNLEEAYEAELESLRQRRGSLKEGMDALDDKVWSTRKKVKSLVYAPKVALHGLGNAFYFSRQMSGLIAPGTPKNERSSWAYLDLCPEGVFSKELFWSGCFRLRSNLQPEEDANLVIRRLSIRLNPPWFSLWVGDFEESYTPLTLWNRNNLDLMFAPKVLEREHDLKMYEHYLDQEPAWPFRGLKVATQVMWPDSKVLSGIKGSVFAHTIFNRFDDDPDTTPWYKGDGLFSQWIFGGSCEVQSAKLWWGGKYLKASVTGQGVLVNQLPGTERPGTPYIDDQPSTWRNSYRVGSVRPELAAVWGNGNSLSGDAEFAFSEYYDDLRAGSSRRVSDYALFAGPTLKVGSSKLSLRYLDVGPYYHSPLAQVQQEAVSTSNILSGLGRPCDVFTSYNRLAFSTFPYGLATPNRRGFGGDLDVRQGAFKAKGALYLVEQISCDLTFNPSQTGYVPVDDPEGTLGAPKRKFLYANFGPAFDLGPALGLRRVMELGANARFERTESTVGKLESVWLLGSLRVGILRFWEITSVFSWKRAYGEETGLTGTTYARTPYLFENQDLGLYSVFHTDSVVRDVRVSNDFRLTGHSDLFLDWGWVESIEPWLPGERARTSEQYVSLNYEVRF